MADFKLSTQPNTLTPPSTERSLPRPTRAMRATNSSQMETVPPQHPKKSTEATDTQPSPCVLTVPRKPQKNSWTTGKLTFSKKSSVDHMVAEIPSRRFICLAQNTEFQNIIVAAGGDPDNHGLKESELCTTPVTSNEFVSTSTSLAIQEMEPSEDEKCSHLHIHSNPQSAPDFTIAIYFDTTSHQWKHERVDNEYRIPLDTIGHVFILTGRVPPINPAILNELSFDDAVQYTKQRLDEHTRYRFFTYFEGVTAETTSHLFEGPSNPNQPPRSPQPPQIVGEVPLDRLPPNRYHDSTSTHTSSQLDQSHLHEPFSTMSVQGADTQQSLSSQASQKPIWATGQLTFSKSSNSNDAIVPNLQRGFIGLVDSRFSDTFINEMSQKERGIRNDQFRSVPVISSASMERHSTLSIQELSAGNSRALLVQSNLANHAHSLTIYFDSVLNQWQQEVDNPKHYIPTDSIHHIFCVTGDISFDLSELNRMPFHQSVQQIRSHLDEYSKHFFIDYFEGTPTHTTSPSLDNASPTDGLHRASATHEVSSIVPIRNHSTPHTVSQVDHYKQNKLCRLDRTEAKLVPEDMSEDQCFSCIYPDKSSFLSLFDGHDSRQGDRQAPRASEYIAEHLPHKIWAYITTKPTEPLSSEDWVRIYSEIDNEFISQLPTSEYAKHFWQINSQIPKDYEHSPLDRVLFKLGKNSYNLSYSMAEPESAALFFEGKFIGYITEVSSDPNNTNTKIVTYTDLHDHVQQLSVTQGEPCQYTMTPVSAKSHYMNEKYGPNYTKWFSDLRSEITSGCTATTCLIRDGVVYTANVGDTRALILSTQGIYVLTQDHHPNHPAEAERLLNSGLLPLKNGQPHPDVGGFENTRSLGDYYVKQYYNTNDKLAAMTAPPVINTPDVNAHVLNDTDQFIVLCTDGVYNLAKAIYNATHEHQSQTGTSALVYYINEELHKSGGSVQNISERIIKRMINIASTLKVDNEFVVQKCDDMCLMISPIEKPID